MPRRVRIDLAYDGTAYEGWQIQPRGATVQGALEAALTRVHGGELTRVRGAGRTDAGVHARGQVADARVGDRLTDRALHRALLSLLPQDIRVVRVATVADSFHARHDAVAKTYAYYVDRSATGDPFVARYVLHEPKALDLDAIDRSLAWLPGTRDWSAFAGAACKVRNRVRTVAVARRERVRRDLDAFVFTADGFLNHMVRNIVGTLLSVGRGRFAPEHLADVIASRDRTRAGVTAPAHGLVLERVDYRGD